MYGTGMFGLKKSKSLVRKTFKRFHLLFFFYKVLEWWRSFSFSREKNKYDSLPIPPPYLRVLVVGTKNLDHFFREGESRVFLMKKLLKPHGLHFNTQEAILDFGCGCGRVLRFLRGYGAPLYGCDYNEKLIKWCRKNLGSFASFEKTNLFPPLPYEDKKFSLVIAVSVFTHLPGDLQLLWIKEFSRIIPSGKHLFLTYHGSRFYFILEEKERKSLYENGILMRDEEGKGSNLCAVFHTFDWLQSNFSDYFEVIEHKEGILPQDQSMILFKRK